MARPRERHFKLGQDDDAHNFLLAKARKKIQVTLTICARWEE